jgi:hypothetical protein
VSSLCRSACHVTCHVTHLPAAHHMQATSAQNDQVRDQTEWL